MDLRQIDCFLAVATDLHFGKAAERLSLAQSSVSEAIRSLEHEVGGRLFVRTSRRVQLTDLGAKLRLGVEPAALVLRATLEDCRKTALGKSNRVRIGFLGGGLYELTLPFVRQLKAKFNLDVDWVELTLLDQFEAVATGKVDAAFCRLPLSHDGLVQGSILFEDNRKLIVPIDHRLADRTLIDPEELALETLPTLPDDHQLGAWAAIHFPDHTPSGRPIARGPVVTTVRECLAVVESGEGVVIFGGRAERYYSNPGIRYIEIDLPLVGTALVRRRADRRRVMADLEKCSRDVAAGLLDPIGGWRRNGNSRPGLRISPGVSDLTDSMATWARAARDPATDKVTEGMPLVPREGIALHRRAGQFASIAAHERRIDPSGIPIEREPTPD